MKKFITICLIMATVFTVNAQDGKPTFEETVEYINTIFKENKITYYNGNNNSGRYVLGISVDKNGKIIIFDRYNGEVQTSKFEVVMSTINLFDIDNYFYNGYALYLKDLNKGQIGNFGSLSASQAPRLEKALKYLTTLCSKKYDPFGG